jgi:hypothetical protein
MRSVLVIIFNQDFSQNIPKLEKLYHGRFSHVIYVVPDHSSKFDALYRSQSLPTVFVKSMDRLFNKTRYIFGKRNLHSLERKYKNVINKQFCRVIGYQYYFYDYITQVSKKLLSCDVDWYWIVADDAILNPQINEETISKVLGLTIDTDCVVCRPVIGSDKWIERISGSVKAGEIKLARALGNKFPVSLNHKIDPEPGAIKNTKISVACADFFGLKKDLLKSVLKYWKRCFVEKIYVEIAVPNTLLAASRSPFILDNFLWEGSASPKEWQRLVAQMIDLNSTFVHPVKLSAVPSEKINWLRTSHVAQIETYGSS